MRKYHHLGIPTDVPREGETHLAELIQFTNGVEVWMPKTVFYYDISIPNKIAVERWFIEKNNALQEIIDEQATTEL